MKKYTTTSRIFEKKEKRKILKRRKRNKFVFYAIGFIAIACMVVFAYKIGTNIGQKIKYPVSYSSYIVKYSEENDLDPYLVIAMIRQESNFVSDARSPYAGGLMQLTEITANEYAGKMGLTDFDYMDPETNIQIGCFVMSSLIDKYDNVDTALAAYNAGVGNVDRWLSNPDYSFDGKSLYNIPFSETSNYIRKIHKYMDEYKNRVDINSDNIN